MKKYQELTCLNKSKNVCIICHLNADTDALCAMVCLREFLLSTFPNLRVSLATDTNTIQSNYNAILEGVELNILPDEIDTAIAIDSPNINRLGKYKDLFSKAKTKIVIDHHLTTIPFGDINISEITSSSCEIIYNIMKEFNYNISNQILGKLYAGIITDTMNLTVGTLSDTTFEIVSKASKTIDVQSIYDNFLNHHSLINIQLLAESIKNIECHFDGKINISYIKPKTMKKLKATFDDFTGIINRLASIQNNVMTCLILPKEETFYVSMRGKRGYNVGEIAKKLGGGGHSGAAAFDSNLKLKEIKKIILSELSQLLKASFKECTFKF